MDATASAGKKERLVQKTENKIHTPPKSLSHELE